MKKQDFLKMILLSLLLIVNDFGQVCQTVDAGQRLATRDFIDQEMDEDTGSAVERPPLPAPTPPKSA